jgi:tRNA threonylcarbamoyladenosine biosynthesis protein TsaE
MKFISNSEEETKNIAKELAKSLLPGDVVVLVGELGSGKTTFTKGICEFFGIDGNEVSSPSFSLLNIYKSEKAKIYHFDFYRLDKLDYVDTESFSEFVYDKKAIKVIEWNKLDLDPTLRTIFVKIKHLSENTREIEIDRDT